MKKSVSATVFLFAAISSILGSGWLFTAYYASTIAGPAALLSWIIAGLCILFIAFVYTELSVFLPVMGASARFPHITHGTLVGFMYGWVIWLCYMSVAPTEVQAIIQYLSFYYPALVKANGGLTQNGYIVAVGLMLSVAILNAYSLRWLLRSNTFFTVIKIVIPLVAIAVIFWKYCDIHRVFHPAHQPFFAMGFKGVLEAISMGGMIFAFTGFTQACELSGLAKRPAISLPVAIVGSITLALLIYLGLQMAFLASLEHRNLVNGWQQLSMDRANSPIAAILHQDGLSEFIPLLFIGALIGPFGAALMYMSGASQSLKSKSKNGYLPRFLQLETTHHAPMAAVAVNFVFGMCLFAPLPGWNNMVAFLTSLMTFMYTIGPICLLALRMQMPNDPRPFRLPFGNIWGTIAFYFCTIFSYFNGWKIISKLGFCFFVGFVILIVYRRFSKNHAPLDWKTSMWIWPYILGLTLISYLGSFGGGENILPFGWDLLVLAIFSTMIMFLAMRFKLSPAQALAHMKTAIKEN